MNKRTFLKRTAVVATGLSIAPSLVLSSCKEETKSAGQTPAAAADATGEFKLPEIPYGYDAFPDVIDEMTMKIHHSRHHQGYTNKLNAALKEAGISGKSLEDILAMDTLPTAIRNNGGGYYNHNLYWDILTPGGGMDAQLSDAITRDFGSMEALKNELTEAGAKRFGSGWAWLCQDADKKLFVSSSPNQDNPLMQTAERRGTPLLGIDVWEHAYYLKYQNKRGDYLQNILGILNWERVGSRMV